MLINQSFIYVALLILSSSISFIFDNFLYIILINLIIFLGGGAIILLAGRAGKILDTAQKIATTVAAGTIAYSNLSGGSNNKNDDKKEDKKDDKKDNKKSSDGSTSGK